LVGVPNWHCGKRADLQGFQNLENLIYTLQKDKHIMSKIQDTTIPLKNNQYYHVYNRGNNGKQIFFQERNYDFFLKRYAKYMNGYWNIFAYALLPNHFHLLIQVKKGAELVEKAKVDLKKVDKNFLLRFLPKSLDVSWQIENLTNRDYLNNENYNEYFGQGDYKSFCYELVEWIATEPFRRFMMSYAKAINKQEERHGSLFQKKFRRKYLSTQLDCMQLTKYIHRNPIHHEIALQLDDYNWTSYRTICSSKETNIKRNETIKWFDNLDHFKNDHQIYTSNWLENKSWYMED
jgi:putative transposase